MIYTVTLNPAVDYVVRLPDFREGETNRATAEEIYFGGKGINVSLVLQALGVETTALGFVAGFTGEALERDLAVRGVHTDLIHLPEGFTRINVKIKTAAGESEINGRGPAVPEAALEALLERLDGLSSGDTLVLAGSVPGSLPADLYESILRRLAGRGIRFAVDAEGALLLSCLPYRPFLIKPNRAELAAIAARPLACDADVLAAAAELQRAGARNVLVSLGGDGALLLDETGGVHRRAALGGKPVNTVGAGDSMLAGFLAGVEVGFEQALALGVAAGGATACAAGLATGEEIRRLLEL